MIFFDTHCHLNDLCYSDDFNTVIDRCYINNIFHIVIIGTNEKSSFKAQYLSQKKKNFYASIGFHPHNANKFNENSLNLLKKISKHPKVIAIGEIGLDFNRMYSTIREQEKTLIKQIKLAKKLNLPIIFHDRNSNGRLVEIIKNCKIKEKMAVIHCFSGKYKDLKNYLDLGLNIGLTGIICMYKRGLSLRNIIGEIPSSRILIETDSPYLTLKNDNIKGKRNEPSFISSLLFNLAKYKNKSIHQISELILENTHTFFHIKT